MDIKLQEPVRAINNAPAVIVRADPNLQQNFSNNNGELCTLNLDC